MRNSRRAGRVALQRPTSSDSAGGSPDVRQTQVFPDAELSQTIAAPLVQDSWNAPDGFDPVEAVRHTLMSAVSILQGIESQVLQQMLMASKYRNAQPGEILYSEDQEAEHVVVLLRGSVKLLQRSPDGLEVLMSIATAPAILRDTELLTGCPAMNTAQAVEKVQAIEIPRQIFAHVLERSPALLRRLLREQAQRLIEAARRHRSLAFDPVDRRLSRALLTYVEMYGLPVAGGVKIRIPLNQDDLARTLGVHRRSITRAIRRWVNEDLLAKVGQSYVVRDVDRLRAYAAQPE